MFSEVGFYHAPENDVVLLDMTRRCRYKTCSHLHTSALARILFNTLFRRNQGKLCNIAKHRTI